MTEPSPDILKCPSCNCKHNAKTDIFGNRIEMDGGTSDFDVREICKYFFLKVVHDVPNIKWYVLTSLIFTHSRYHGSMSHLPRGGMYRNSSVALWSRHVQRLLSNDGWLCQT